MSILKEAADQISERSHKLRLLENMHLDLSMVVIQYGTINYDSTSMLYTKDIRYPGIATPFTVEVLAKPINPEARYSQSSYPSSSMTVSVVGYSKALYIDGEESRQMDKATLPETTLPIDGIPVKDIANWHHLVNFVVGNIEEETPQIPVVLHT